MQAIDFIRPLSPFVPVLQIYAHSPQSTKIIYFKQIIVYICFMKKKPGAPTKPVNDIKRSMTCSVSNTTSDKAIKHFGNRGKAIELAVKYHTYILGAESAKNEL